MEEKIKLALSLGWLALVVTGIAAVVVKFFEVYPWFLVLLAGTGVTIIIIVITLKALDYVADRINL